MRATAEFIKNKYGHSPVQVGGRPIRYADWEVTHWFAIASNHSSWLSVNPWVMVPQSFIYGDSVKK